ncbi:nitroreductase family protein [Sphingomonas mesophila]|uniref:nitroreductase family protein n=1 Tax=Sphingomonas mesophila TaxID=2303576 RepID=UPI000E58F8D6|nr:nitroreductase [Sphingomonas mesophila]
MELNDASSALALLASRRSARPRDLTEPGPDAAQLARILEIAARVPDHAQLVPFRFVSVAPEQRGALRDLYCAALAKSDPDAPEAKVAKAIANARAAPTLVVLISRPVAGHKVPVFEQELTCGAAGMNLLHAATALGFAGGWITGWSAYDETVAAAFCEEGERIAGFIYLGTPVAPVEERVRPAMERIVSEWRDNSSPERGGGTAQR